MTWSAGHRLRASQPGAGIEAIRLANGHWALIYNDIDGAGTRWPSRSRTTRGPAWKGPATSSGTGPAGVVHYPSIIQAADGTIHVTYTHGGNPEGSTIRHATL